MVFWDRLEQALRENNITAAELSRKIGVASSVVNSWKMRDSIPRADIAVKTAEALGTTVEYLITGNQNESLYVAESLGAYVIPVMNQDPDNRSYGVESYIKVPAALEKYGPNLIAFTVNGDSMETTLKNGTLALVYPKYWDKSDGLYAIEMNSNYYIKRIQVVADKVLIISDNPKYKTIEQPVNSTDFKIIGCVVAAVETDIK